MIHSAVIAGLLCAAFAAAEGVLAGRDAAAVLRSIKQPRWAPPMWVWYLIGVVYYAACYLTLYRLLELGRREAWPLLPLALLAVMMAANAIWNLVFFRWKNFRLSFQFFVAYGLLVGLLLWQVTRLDGAAGAALTLYALYLPYACLWTYRVWKLNRMPAAVGKCAEPA